MHYSSRLIYDFSIFFTPLRIPEWGGGGITLFTLICYRYDTYQPNHTQCKFIFQSTEYFIATNNFHLFRSLNFAALRFKSWVRTMVSLADGSTVKPAPPYKDHVASFKLLKALSDVHYTFPFVPYP